MPNTPLAEEDDRIGWESFPLLVESLEDEKEEQYHLLRTSLSFRRFPEDIEVVEACCRSSDSNSSSPKSTCSKSTTRRKSVAFSTVAILDYQVIVGDHPYAADSLPLSLGWAHAEESRVVDLNTYETIRSPHRRCVSDMQLSFLDRKNILKRVSGLSERDIMHEQRRAFRDGLDDPSHPSAHMRRVHTVAAMAQAQTLQQREKEEAAHPENDPAQPPPPPPPAVAHAIAHAIRVNPGCPIHVEPRHASGITAAITA